MFYETLQFHQFDVPHPQIKAESQHFNIIITVLYEIQYAGVQSRLNKKCVLKHFAAEKLN